MAAVVRVRGCDYFLRRRLLPSTSSKQNQTDSQTIPPHLSGLTAELSEIAIGAGQITTPLGKTTKGAFCLLTVTIQNSGEPCAVDQFRLKVVLSSGAIVFGESQGIPEQLTLGTASGISQTFYGEDQLSYKTKEPITKGGFVRGRMIYFFPHLHANHLAGAGTVIQFEMKDAFGRMCSAEKTIKAVQPAAAFLHFPGLRPPSTNLQKPRGDRSQEVKDVINAALRIAEKRGAHFMLYVMQQAGVGDLHTDEEFHEVREALIQHRLPDATAGLNITTQEIPWLDVIKLANKKQIDLLDGATTCDCISEYLNTKQL